MDASIESVRAGKFLKALVREEIRQNKDWVIRLRTLPETPETYYLMALMASHDFQTALQNYLDLEDVRKKLVTWQSSFDSFEDIIELRRRNYEPLLPEIDAKFRELDSQIRLRQEQRKHVEERLHAMLTAPRPEHLATADERIILESVNALEKQIEGADGPEAASLQQRIQRLKGVLTWSLQTQYHERLTEAHTHLNALNADVAAMTAQYDAFVRARQAATHSYVGYDVPITRLRRRVERCAPEGLARDGPTGARARDGRDQRARCAPRSPGVVSESGALCGGGQLRPRHQGAGRRTGQPTGQGGAALMRTARTALILATVVVAACAPTPEKGTLAQLRNVQAEIKEVQVEQGLDKAMESYRRYLEETPKTAMTPEAMRRLADLKVEKQFGILGDGKLMELEAPEDAAEAIKPQLSQAQPSKSTTPTLAKPEVRKIRSIEDSSVGAQAPKAAGIADLSESQKEFERRATEQNTVASERRSVRCHDARQCAGNVGVRTAGSDRALRSAARGVPDLRAQRQGAVSEVPRLRRAGADRGGDEDDGASHR